MSADSPPVPARQSRLTDDFFYFFLRLRKDRIRKVVADINDRYPGGGSRTAGPPPNRRPRPSFLSWEG